MSSSLSLGKEASQWRTAAHANPHESAAKPRINACTNAVDERYALVWISNSGTSRITYNSLQVQQRLACRVSPHLSSSNPSGCCPPAILETGWNQLIWVFFPQVFLSLLLLTTVFSCSWNLYLHRMHAPSVQTPPALYKLPAAAFKKMKPDCTKQQ